MSVYKTIRYESAGVEVYATLDDLPLSGVEEGSQALVDSTDRLYIWSDTGWYNIALINTTPSISGAASTYDLPSDGSAVTITISSTDPEGLPITYSIASDTSANTATVVQGTGANTNIFTVTPSTNSADAGTFSLTFRASDGINIASAVSTFTLNFVTLIADSNYTAALVTSVGANLADNNDFVDSSTNSHTITPAGNVMQNTFSPYRHGGYSTYFDGSGDYLSAIDHANFDMGTGNFTIELWMYADSQSTSYPALVSSSNYNSAGSSSLRFDNTSQNDKLYLYCNSASPSADPLLVSSSTLSLNEWHHVALVRDGTSLKFYVDGTENGSVTIGAGQTFDFSVGELRVGRGFDVDGAGGYFTGHISDLRIVKGTAITPPSGGPTERLTAVTNTSLLTCHLPYIADGSTNSHAITINGNTKTKPVAPYDYIEYASSTHGGSMHFDGTGDYLEIDDGTWLTLGNGNFCFETWIYNTASTGSGQWIFGQGNSAGTAAGVSVELYITAGRTLSGGIYVGSQKYATSTGTIPIDTWTHVALVRNGTNIQIYINGTKDGENTSAGTDSAIDQSTHFSIGRAGEYNGLYFVGAIADFRFVKGDSIYTGGFDPPTAALTAITNTQLLLSGTNAGIIDKSQSIRLITLSGDAKSSTTQSKYLSSSMYFDGTGDYVNIENILAGWTSAFTIEAWVYHTSFGAYSNPIFTSGNSGSVGVDFFEFGANNVGRYQVFWGGGSPLVIASVQVSTNTWTHVALVRETDNSCTIYIDGISRGTFTKSGAIPTPSSPIRSFIGTQSYSEGAGGRTMIGYLSDVRITKGLARYTAADESANIPSEALKG